MSHTNNKYSSNNPDCLYLHSKYASIGGVSAVGQVDAAHFDLLLGPVDLAALLHVGLQRPQLRSELGPLDVEVLGRVDLGDVHELQSVLEKGSPLHYFHSLPTVDVAVVKVQ